MTNADDAHHHPVAGGHDIVSLKSGETVKGSSRYFHRYDGRVYFFASRETLSQFRRTPQDYVPVLGGDCVVYYAKGDQRVAGRANHSVVHEGRLYLFASERTKRAFIRDRAAYESADLAANGESVVWLVATGRHVAGSPERTELHNGLRYQFLSERDQKEFRQHRSRYATASMKIQDSDADDAVKVTASDAAAAKQRLHIARSRTTARQVPQTIASSQLRALSNVGQSPSTLAVVSALQKGLPPALDGILSLEAADRRLRDLGL